MKKFIPQSARRRIIENPKIVAARTPASAGPAMTVVRLPAALAGAENCVGALICRQTTSDTVASIWLGRTYAFHGAAPDSFVILGRTKGFAIGGTLVTPTTGGRSIVDVAVDEPENTPPKGFQMTSLIKLRVALTGVDRIMPEVCDFDALADATLLFCGDEIMSVAGAEMTADSEYALTLLRGRFGTAMADHLARNRVWIVSRARLKAFRHPVFVGGNALKFKIAVGKQPLANTGVIEVKL